MCSLSSSERVEGEDNARRLSHVAVAQPPRVELAATQVFENNL